MKSFCIKIVLFLLLIFLISFASIYGVYRIIDSGNYFTVNKKIKNIVFGHSHTECAFNDKIIKNTLNLSNGGESSFYTYFKLKKVIENNRTIKNVFLSFSNNQIDISIDEGTIWSDKYMDKWFTKYGAFMDFNDLKILFKNNPTNFFKVQSLTLKEYLTFLIKDNENIIADQYWGKYNKLKENKIDSILSTNKAIIKPRKDFQYSTINLYYFKKSIQLCKDNNVKIYLVRCPVNEKWAGLNNECFFQKIVKNELKEVDFLDFKNLPLENNCFADEDHINYKGAAKFSMFFNSLLEKGLLVKKDKQEFINLEMKDL